MDFKKYCKNVAVAVNACSINVLVDSEQLALKNVYFYLNSRLVQKRTVDKELR